MKFTCTVLDAMRRLAKSRKDVKESKIVNFFTQVDNNNINKSSLDLDQLSLYMINKQQQINTENI
jgi:hypothetical protein